jgi:hypothetical protein
MKKLILTIGGCFFTLWGIFALTGYRFVIHISNYEVHQKTFSVGDTVQVLKSIDLASGNWSAFLVLDKADFDDLSPSIPKVMCLKTKDMALIKLMQSHWNGIYRNADMATVTSHIYIFKDNQLMFKSGIVLDKNSEGLQNQEFGWLEPLEKGVLTKHCSAFKPVFFPIVFL